MARRISILVLVALVIVPAASAAGPADRKQHVDEQLSHLHDKIAAARAREDELRSQIDSVSTEIHGLEGQVGDVSVRLAPLEQDLALHQRQLERLNELFRVQTTRLHFLRRQYRIALERLELRVVAIYEAGEVGTIDIVFSTASFSDMLEQVDFSDRIREQDQDIAVAVGTARNEVRTLRAHTQATRTRVATVTRTIQARTEQVRALRDSLIARENALSAAREKKQHATAETRTQLKEMLAEADALRDESADLAGKIHSAEGTTSASRPSESGLIWPVGGPVVSPFGWRCLEGVCRPHEGIDIAAGDGASIRAAATGTVIYAGWEGGYGLLVLVDHGGGLATAYAHQSRLAVSSGARLAQGQVIGYVGCTGHCLGPHLHFEVRVNGSAVDPLGYL